MPRAGGLPPANNGSTAGDLAFARSPDHHANRPSGHPDLFLFGVGIDFPWLGFAFAKASGLAGSFA